MLYLAQSLLLLILFIRSLLREGSKGDGRSAVLFGMLLAGAAVFEANVVLYTPVQLHRMMLAVTISYGLLLIELGTWEPAVCEVILIAGMAFLFAGAPQNFALPQIDGQTLSAEGEEALRKELAQILPLREDPWDNTIAKVPEFGSLQWEFMLPTYTSLNVCQNGVMEELIGGGTLRSRFVILEETSGLNARCAEKKYRIVWKGYGRTLYQTRE